MPASISSNTFSSMCLTAKEISDIAGRDVECMGYLLAEKGSRTITGFYFPEQHGDDAESGTGDFPYRQFYENGRHMAGMWHSHGFFPVLHSPIDFNHAKNRLQAMQRENALLDAWDFYCGAGSMELFNRETMQGIKIALSGDYKPEIRAVHEILPEKFLSIVINHETYNGKGGAYDAMVFSLEGNELKKEKAGLDIRPLIAGKNLEEIADNYTIGGLLLKDNPDDRKRTKPKIGVQNNAVEAASKYGCFSIQCENPQELADSIEDIGLLSGGELNRYKEKLPKKPCAKESIENIVNEKPLLSLRQHEFSEPSIEAMQAHAFYVRLFLSAMGFYQRSESCKRYMHADKAVIDLFAALSGALESSTVGIMQILSKIEDAGAPLDVYACALKEANDIIEKQEHVPEKKHLLKRIKSLLKKAKKEAEHA